MKFSILVAILCSAAIGLCSEQKDSPAKNETPAANSTPTPMPSNGDHKPADQTETAKGGSPHWYTSSEWWLVIIAALTGFAIAYQAREMVKTTEIIGKQVDLMKRQTDILVEYNKATREAADAAGKSADIAKLSVDHMISKERARIRIEMDEVKLGDRGDRYAIDEVTFRLFCHGTTPAFIVERMGRVTVSDSPVPVKTVLHPIAGSLPDVVYPSPAAVITSTVIIHQHLDDAKRDAIQQGKLILQFYGQIKYRDVFDNIRETRFRYLWRVSEVTENTRVTYWTKHIDEDNCET
jgi:hypothetical protein